MRRLKLMQPAIAIPPYDPERIQALKGLRVRVPTISNPHKFWWVEIIDTRFISQATVLVLVAGSGDVDLSKRFRFGNPKWVGLGAIRFKNHTDDPFLIRIIKGRESLTPARQTSPRNPRNRPASSLAPENKPQAACHPESR